MALDTPPPRPALTLGAGAFLLGLAAGAALSPGRGAVSALVAATGSVLLVAFRVYEGRAAAQEDRIAGLEAHRHAIQAQNDRLERLRESITRAVSAAIESVPGADGPQSRVAPIAVALGRELGLEEDELAGLRTAALLHDIGRLDIPAEIWAKPAALSPEEWEQVRRYPARGANLLAPVDFPWPVTATIRAQQERWDGTGGPDGLGGERIPLAARILAVADAYNAMLSERPHRPARLHREAIELLREESGRRFDPRVVAAFERIAARGDFLDLCGAP